MGSTPPAFSQVPDFKDKQLTMIVGSAPGGGTDAAARLVALFLGKHLPGRPTFVVKNIPGADGVTALNFVVEQTKPDGMTVVVGSSTQVDPMTFRKVNARYNPSDLQIVGGIGRGGSVLLINKENMKRLEDKSAPPLVMGSNPGMPRNSMQMTLWGIEYLKWNAKWVVGYRSTNDLILALERGEIDMTADGNRFLIEKLVKSGKFVVLVQTGDIVDGKTVRRPDSPQTPTLVELLDGKVTDAVAKKAFVYWESINATDKWVSLPPGTPKSIVEVYRQAFDAATKDPEFLEKGKAISQDFEPQKASDVERLINNLAATPQEVLDYNDALMKKQGLSGS
jgi:tripartite-type tricarboxylate transporter receptor subunit TctC